ncbi:SDR family oxidoreductase [Fodinibius salsisoli]|uniref:SDR family oxidoreductase n=1 Tax=Fodinibius salsisoli TaxID=2820877 RepID=A0ABT3PPS2_9BACT|nr:SDR family NAD(P)-dependent oxidoreductase [Fodinibius salsisoli]MCW9707864.1 SDR family oxidoreductase [Fodinibius salsisoli]
MELANNKILITGATAGIGKAIAKEFLKHNNTIIAVGRDKRKFKSLQAISDRIIPFQCDLANSLQLEELVLFIEQKHPDTNILINNAGIQYNYRFADEQHITDRIKHELEVNLYAPLALTGLLLPILTLNEQPAIVNISSGLALAPKKQAPVYCASKAAIHNFSKSLRYQLEESDVHVFEVIPPLVDTGMTQGRGRGKISPEQLSREFIKKFQKNRYEIAIGKVKWLKLLRRLSPALADRLLKNGSEN